MPIEFLFAGDRHQVEMSNPTAQVFLVDSRQPAKSEPPRYELPKSSGWSLPDLKLVAANDEVAQRKPEIKPASDVHINVMAPLLVGDPANTESEFSRKQWANFDRQLAEAKKLGITAVSTDIWWGLVQAKGEKDFDWKYYDKLSKHISEAGLKWIPILSFHACGGNVGDDELKKSGIKDGKIPVPQWVWDKVSKDLPSSRSAKFVSEQGNASDEFVSAWATEKALPYYANMMKEFQKHYAKQAKDIAEINISLGPAGELRYPSYNAHDSGTGYPTRGALQCYSELAKTSFREFAIEKYGGIDGVAKAWNIPGLKADKISPPEDAQGFFNRQDHVKIQYGKDFFDWYSDSLLNHGSKMLESARVVFADKDAAFQGIDIGAKIPGIHWRYGVREDGKFVQGDRLAELSAGLIRTSNNNEWFDSSKGAGYRPILSMFTRHQPMRPGMGTRVVPAMTCLELSDGQDGKSAASQPHTLALSVGQEARRLKLTINGENALSGTLSDAGAWDNMRSLMQVPGEKNGYYTGLTLLRIGDVVDNPVARAKLSEIISAVNSIRREAEKKKKAA